jgi:hypothetical protein
VRLRAFLSFELWSWAISAVVAPQAEAYLDGFPDDRHNAQDKEHIPVEFKGCIEASPFRLASDVLKYPWAVRFSNRRLILEAKKESPLNNRNESSKGTIEKWTHEIQTQRSLFTGEAVPAPATRDSCFFCR